MERFAISAAFLLMLASPCQCRYFDQRQRFQPGARALSIRPQVVATLSGSTANFTYSIITATGTSAPAQLGTSISNITVWPPGRF